MSHVHSSSVAANELTGTVLVVDDHASARDSMADILSHAGHQVHCCSSAVEALRLIEQRTFDVIVSDLRMPGMDGLEFIRELRQHDEEAQIVMITAHATISAAVDAMRYGAFDFIEKPFDVDQLEQLVSRAISQGSLPGQRSFVQDDEDWQANLLGSSPEMQALRERIDLVAPTDETVLITGESGTGKELVARSIHAASMRAKGPLVSLNCPALSPQLMESELFGHERGAFTSADAPRVGRFELASQGTILLDEISEIDPPLQAKLLRVLQERSFERVGSSESIRVDVRVLATTNRDLQQEIARGEFREDLFFRLAVVPLEVPPLRNRRSDVAILAEHFLGRAAARLGRTPCQLSPSALDLLVNYCWPGNVRELENIMTRTSVLGQFRTVEADQLRPWLIGTENQQDGSAASKPQVAVGTSLQDMERTLVEATLEQFDGHRERTAKALGIGVRTLANKLRSYGYAPRERSFACRAEVA